ncbi:MAG TPA: YdcF family protein, partial [Myxococcota bacterium]|nr:YdcF family protein [Myxococcota bacterium]
PAAAILVFGARAYADGRPSDALSDRVRAAAALYHQGLAPLVIMSGGPGDGATHETQAMRALAQSLGVPADRIILDEHGLNTRASIRNCRHFGAGPLLAVSHSYHLPRIKLEADRAGVPVYTVPAPQGRPLRKLPLFVARETVAWWWYYARPA